MQCECLYNPRPTMINQRPAAECRYRSAPVRLEPGEVSRWCNRSVRGYTRCPMGR